MCCNNGGRWNYIEGLYEEENGGLFQGGYEEFASHDMMDRFKTSGERKSRG